jgi:alcohol dehydrogenase
VVAMDTLDYRLGIAASKGADTINTARDDWKEKAMAASDGRGFDKVIEVVGSPESLQIALDIIRPGGVIAAMGVFCDDQFNLVLIDVFLRDISLHMNGFANVQPFMWEGLRMLERGAIQPDQYFSHNFSLANIDEAFKTFHEKTDDVLKVLIRP